jgi:hypothetical protein
MEIQKKYLKYYVGGMIGGLSEVILLHPVDFIKTKIQHLKKRNIIRNKKRYFKKVYSRYGIKPFLRGFFPRIYGITPMRTLFFGTLTLSDKILTDNHIPYSKFLAGAIAGSIQTLLDCPLENYKTKQIFGLSTLSFYKGFLPHILRNVGFASLFFIGQNYFTEHNIHPLLGNAVAGFGASFFTHPLDVWKTLLQGNMDYTWKTFLRREVLISGLMSRCSYTFCAMMIGFTTHNYIVNDL